ncbi:MAG: histidinol-phosphate transaminase [Defluviitaleaceae bacterium]|nr:histidinol-phosphate transaminase [Defluviitaleaceae bacterium]
MDFLSEKARRLTPYVAGLQPQEAGWIKLNTNENPYPPSPQVTEALNAVDIAKLRLYPDGESEVLKSAIAESVDLKPENIFCANSSDEVLALAFQAFFSGKKRIISPDISYGFYPVWAEMYDAEMIFAPVCRDFLINPSDYKNANGVVIANPNAPTSLAMGLCEIEEILCANANSVVIIDEAYIDFADTDSFKSAVSLVNSYENLLVVRTFSKSHSMAGMRVGYALGRASLIDGLRRVRDAFNSYPLDMLAQTAATAAIKDTEYLGQTIRRIVKTRDKTIFALREMGFNVLQSQANFIFFESEKAAEIYEFLLKNKILVRYWKKPRICNLLRVSIGTESDMEVFTECVNQFLREGEC